MIAIFIINGEDVQTEVHWTEPFSVTIQDALTKSHNTGRPATDWELRDLDGGLIETSEIPKDYGVEPGSRFFLTLRIGAGGALDEDHPPKSWLCNLLHWNETNRWWEANISYGEYPVNIVLRAQPDPNSEGDLWDAWIHIEHVHICTDKKPSEIDARVSLEQKLRDYNDVLRILLGSQIPFLPVMRRVSQKQAREAITKLQGVIGQPKWLRAIGISESPPGFCKIHVHVGRITQEVSKVIPGYMDEVPITVVAVGRIRLAADG